MPAAPLLLGQAADISDDVGSLLVAQLHRLHFPIAFGDALAQLGVGSGPRNAISALLCRALPAASGFHALALQDQHPSSGVVQINVDPWDIFPDTGDNIILVLTVLTVSLGAILCLALLIFGLLKSAARCLRPSFPRAAPRPRPGPLFESHLV